MSWQIQSGVNDGYPYHAENTAFPSGLCAPYPSRMMCVDGVTNDGYPYRLSLWVPPAEDTGVRRLYYGTRRVMDLRLGSKSVTACCRGCVVFRK